MTRFPTENRMVTGLPLDDEHLALKVGPTCGVPGCRKLTDHGHHVFSRGLMGGDFKWVRMDDSGVEVFNLIPLCWKHHELVTINKARIKWDGFEFQWDDGENDPVGLVWQPPVIRPEGVPVIHTLPKEEAEQLGAKPYGNCPTCKRRYRYSFPRDHEHRERPRPRRTWGLAVPADKEENGYEVLEELFELARDKMEDHGLDWGEGKKNKYFVLATLLALFVQHADDILSDS